MAMTKPTLKEFVDSRDYGTLPEEYTGNFELMDHEIVNFTKGWIYMGFHVIEDTTTWKDPSKAEGNLYYCLMGNEEWLGNNIAEGEAYLYQHIYGEDND